MNYTLLGEFDRNRSGHPEHYYAERFTTLDFRGPLEIHPQSIWGLGNTVITTSHDISTGEWKGAMIDKPVVVEAFAWITSCCILYNCRIGQYTVVSIGTVVANMTLPPYTMWAGNPARQVAVWENGKWVR